MSTEYQRNWSPVILFLAVMVVVMLLALAATHCRGASIASAQADYNDNGIVDAADYNVWRDTNGTAAAYDLWKSQFGQTINPPPPDDFTRPAGHFVMQAVNNQNVNDATISSPKLTGFHLRGEWQIAEPANNSYNWTWFDQQLARATRLGKHVTLGTYSGNNSPAWLGVPLVDSVPLPWDARVTSAWVDYVEAFGARYDNHPAIDAVHISGPATNESMEMHYPAGLTSVSGYSDQKVIDTWKLSIDAYAAAFPSHTLVLDVAPVPNWQNPVVTNAVIDYMQQILGDRASYIMCSLKASTNPNAMHYQLIKSLGEEGEYVGFEMVGPSSDKTRFGGPFSEALALGEAAGAAWYQIYQYDVRFLPSAQTAYAAPELSSFALLLSALASVVPHARRGNGYGTGCRPAHT